MFIKLSNTALFTLNTPPAPANFEICVDAIRAFVEASMNGVNKMPVRTQKKSRRGKAKQEEVADTSESNTEEYHKETITTKVIYNYF